MNQKFRALICKTQLKNMKAAGFKLLDVVDTGDHTTSVIKTLKLAKWRYEYMMGTDGAFAVEIDAPTNFPMNKIQLYERIFDAGVDKEAERSGMLAELARK